MKKLKGDNMELHETNQLLKDEYTTLQLTLMSAEKKLKEVNEQNAHLVGPILELKEESVAQMNLENDLFLMKKQENVKKQLAEAAREPKKVIVRPQKGVQIGAEKLDSLTCHATRIPTRAFLKFTAHDSEVNAIKWSPHGLVVATGGADRKIKLWDVSKGSTYECKGVLSGCNGAVMSVDFDA